MRRDDRDRAGQPAVLRDVAVYDAVQKDRAQREPHRAIDCAFERQLIGRSGTCGDGAGEVDGELVALDYDRHRDFQVAPRRIRIVQIAVDEGLGRIDAIRNVADRPRIRRSE